MVDNQPIGVILTLMDKETKTVSRGEGLMLSLLVVILKRLTEDDMMPQEKYIIEQTVEYLNGKPVPDETAEEE
jgi:hypothetical protein